MFFTTLLIFGSIQAIQGTLRWYNASEESHEKLTGEHVYTLRAPEKKGIFSAYSPKTQDPKVYFVAHNEDIQEALKSVSPEKVSKITVRVAQMEEIVTPTTQIQTPIENTVVFQTPVSLEVRPENYGLPSGYSGTIHAVIEGKYFRDALWEFPIIVDRDRTSPRGQMSNESVTLSGKIQSLSEMAKVLVHELGHMVDIYLLRKDGFSSDPSKIFYTISWSEPTVMKSGISLSSFVSGYAASNQYEDFAESFAMYVFHNKAFRERAVKDSLLQKKYDFLHSYVFGELFLGSSYEKDVVPAKLWDVTKIVIRTNALADVFTVMRDLIYHAL